MEQKSLWDYPAIASYMNRIGANPEKLTECVVLGKGGKYQSRKCVIRFSLDGEIICKEDQYQPTAKEKEEIRDVIVNQGAGQMLSLISVWPLDELKQLPPGMSERDTYYTYYNQKHQIIMIRHRIDSDTGKEYIPWTYWSDNVWRRCEPDGKFPLYNQQHIGIRDIVFLHEGEKAAERMQYQMNHVDGYWKDHPWGMDLKDATHLGWCTGANTPERTDWAPLNRAKIKEVYIVADNDDIGRSAVSKIARKLRHPTFLVQFSDLFPEKFDLADDFPKKFYKKRGDSLHYIGPSFQESLHVATWVTDIVKRKDTKGRERVAYKIRDSFKNLWAYIEDINAFVCTKFPWIRRDHEVLKNTLLAFSDSDDPVKLIIKNKINFVKKLSYRPDVKQLLITDGDTSIINAHVGSKIKSINGDYQPFIEFMEYLVPKESERYEVLKWCATLIAKPEIRIGYALLLISQNQGTGKTTLGQEILCPLVGTLNVSFPGDQDITSPFNEWVAFKRLAIIGEIYTGHSWKPYHALKGIITDRTIAVNQKYIRQFHIDNWCHIYACSNSLKALKMSAEDRRWYVPEITEDIWPEDKFIEFYKWLETGGLHFIKYWAETFPEYIRPGAVAPKTPRKESMAEASKSDSQTLTKRLGGIASEEKEPIALFSWDIKTYLRADARVKVFEGPKELMDQCAEGGMHRFYKRIKFEGLMQNVAYNDAALEILDSLLEHERVSKLKEFRKRPSELLSSAKSDFSPSYRTPEDMYED